MKNYLCPVSLLGTRMHTADQERYHSESFNKHFKLFKQDVNTEERQWMKCVHSPLGSPKQRGGHVMATHGFSKTQTFTCRNLLTAMLLVVKGFTGDRVHAKHVNFRKPLLSTVWCHQTETAKVADKISMTKCLRHYESFDMGGKCLLDAVMLIWQNLKYSNNKNNPPFSITFFSFSVND